MTVYSLLPTLVIIICNIIIIKNVVDASRKRREMMGTQQKADDGTRQMSITLITVSVFALVTTMPYTMLQIFYGRNIVSHEMYTYLWPVFFLLAHFNNTFNIFLYLCSGPTFRRNLKSIMKRNHIITYLILKYPNTLLIIMLIKYFSGKCNNGHA